VKYESTDREVDLPEARNKSTQVGKQLADFTESRSTSFLFWDEFRICLKINITLM